MENEVENTVGDMQEDNNAIKQMRERIKELESVEKEFKSVQMANAIKDAGFDPESGEGKALKDLYKGELQADAIKEFASNYGWGNAPAEPSQEELEAFAKTKNNFLLIMVGEKLQLSQLKKNYKDKELFLVKIV